MRNIVVVRGPQGSGKSSFIRRCGLAGHHLSFDKMREAVSGDTLSPDGSWTIPQQHNKLVWKLTMESLDRRLEAGETIAFEGTLPKRSDVENIIRRARGARYQVLIVDFYDVPMDAAKAFNGARPERSRVPPAAIERTYKAASTQPLPAGIDAQVHRVSDPRDTHSAEHAVLEFLRRQTLKIDVSEYEKIVFIGDLQGTVHPLFDERSPLHGGFRDDVFYVFCGDLFDRGLENAGVAQWWLDRAAGRENARLIAGNHEDHVERCADGIDPVSREWADHTWPQMEAAGLTPEDMKTIAEGTVPLLNLSFRGTDILATHGGFSRWPDHLHLIPDAVYRRGSGHHDQGIDELWSQSEAEGEGSPRYQVHGHRNTKLLPVRAGDYSFNLEGQVEFGGHMRFAVLDQRGWHTAEIRSTNYRTMQAERAIAEGYGRQPFGNEAPITPWAKEGRDQLEPLSDATLSAFANHDMIAVRQSEAMPHIASVNFTKQAFYRAAWDDYTSVARGLFIDREDNTIVARSFEKFFNHGERAATSDGALQENLSFPVEGYDKINGFLGITGYSERTGELVVASKSRIESKFADWARAVIAEKIGTAGLEKLLRFNRDQKASLIFEIVDMTNDPHIIDYPENRLVLIGCVRRHEVFEQADYETLRKIAKWLGCEVKGHLFRNIRDWRALESVMDRVENDPSWRSDNPTEGLVFEDASGFQWKSKAHFYASWKRMRSATERIALCRRKDVPFDRDRYADLPDFSEFLDWAETLPAEALSPSTGIVALRNMWMGDRAKAEAMGPPPSPPERKVDMSGYEKAVREMASRVASGTAKPESVMRMVKAAEANDLKREVLDNLDAGSALRSFVREHNQPKETQN